MSSQQTPDQEQWNSLLDEAFGAEQPATQAEAAITEPQVPASVPPVQVIPAPRNLRFWPTLAAAVAIIILAMILLFPRKTVPPELLKCKEALEELQARNYHLIEQITRICESRDIKYSSSHYIKAENDVSYSTVDAGSLFRNDDYGDTLYTSKVIRDGKTYTRAYYEKEGPTSYQQTDVFEPIPTPWLLLFNWDDHSIQLLETCAINKYEEYIAIHVTESESGCDCCGYAYYTLYFLFSEGKLVMLTQAITLSDYFINTYTEHRFAIRPVDAEECNAMIDSINLDS